MCKKEVSSIFGVFMLVRWWWSARKRLKRIKATKKMLKPKSEYHAIIQRELHRIESRPKSKEGENLWAKHYPNSKW